MNTDRIKKLQALKAEHTKINTEALVSLRTLAASISPGCRYSFYIRENSDPIEIWCWKVFCYERHVEFFVNDDNSLTLKHKNDHVVSDMETETMKKIIETWLIQ